MVVAGQPVDVRAVLAVLGNEVSGPVLVLEDADIARDVAERLHGEQEAERTEWIVGHGHADMRVVVVAALGMDVHHVFAGGRAAQHLGAFGDGVGGEQPAFAHAQHDALAAPMGQIVGRVAGHALEPVAVRLVLAVGIVRAAETLDAQPVQLGDLAVVVQREADALHGHCSHR